MAGAAAIVAVVAIGVAVVLFFALRDGDTDDVDVVRYTVDGRPSAVATAAGKLWVADDAANALVVLDRESGRAIGSPIAVGANPAAVVGDEDGIWVAHASGDLRRVNTRTAQVDASVRVGGRLVGAAIDGPELWLADLDGRQVVRVERGTGRITARVDVPAGAVRVAAGGGVVWVTNLEDSVTAIDAESLEVGEPVTVGPGPIGVAVDRTGRAWVAVSEAGTVVPVRRGAARAGPPVARCPQPVAVTVADEAVWVACRQRNVLVRVELESESDVTEVELEAWPRGVTAGEDRVWVAAVDPSRVVGVRIGQPRKPA